MSRILKEQEMYRDNTTVKMNGKRVLFKTIYSVVGGLTPHCGEYVRREQLEFNDEESARIYYNYILETLKR